MNSKCSASHASHAVKLMVYAAEWVEAYDSARKGNRRAACAPWNLMIKWARGALASESGKGRRCRIDALLKSTEWATK